MTTVATDGKTMAADRLVTGDGIIHGTVTKLHRLEDGSVMGLCGSAFQYDQFAAWYNSGRAEGLHVADEMEALVLHPDGTVSCYNQHGYSFKHSLPASCGSGCSIAYGAMEAGASPMEAVEIACKRDIRSGGGVDCMSI